MTAADREDDGDGDDPMVRGMRSVWLEMRDEEPPSGGLAALMAAARAQAEVMTPVAEPWWRRMFAGMLRPPVLAAASVLVLVGGIVVLKGRGADEVASPTAVTIETDRDRGERGKDDKMARGEAAQTIAPVEPSPAKEAGNAGFGAGSGSPSAPPPPPSPPPRRARPSGISEPAKPNAPTADPKKDDQPRKEKRPADAGDMVIVNEGLEIGGGRTPPDDGKPTDAQPPKPAPEPKVDSREGQGTTGTKIQRGPANQQVSTEQLVKQTEVAANRNDCPAVRVTAERIKKLDATAYKRVAGQPAIARCLK